MKWLDLFIRDLRIKKAFPYLSNAKQVLDIGSGDGELCRLLANHGIKGIGIDTCSNEAFVPEGFKFVLGSFPDALPNGKSFDAISVLAVLEHISEDKKTAFVKACFERLSVEGFIVLTVPSPKVDVILSVLKFMRLVDGIAIDQHHGFSPVEVKPLFELAGFKLFVHKKFQFGLNNLFIFKKKT